MPSIEGDIQQLYLSFDELARLRKQTFTAEDEELQEKALITAMALHLYEEQPKAKTKTAKSREKAAKEERRQEIFAQSKRVMDKRGHSEPAYRAEKPEFDLPSNLPSFVSKGGCP